MSTKAQPAAQYLPAFENFDQLPDSAYVKQPVVEALYTCSPATLWRRVGAGLIPPPDKLSPRSNGWKVGRLRKSLSEVGAGDKALTATGKQPDADNQRRPSLLTEGTKK